jgi:phage gp36-like protein
VPLVDDADVQIHLPVDKLKVEEIPDDLLKAKDDADRIVRGYLAGVVTSAILASWVTPATTPNIIRAIAGRFCAALIYRTRYSENSLDDPEFAQNKYNEAMAMLQAIIAGTLVIDGVDTGTDFDNTWFEPNANSIDPIFTMVSQF